MNKWKILSEDRAKDLHIRVEGGHLIINASYIPENMEIEEFLDYIQKENIVISEANIKLL